MTTTTGIVCSTDAAIQQRPDLLDAVKQATAFLEAEYAKGPPPRTTADVSLSWYLTKTGDEEFTRVILHEQKRDGGSRGAAMVIPVRHLFDPVNRDIWMLRLWRDVLSKRSEENMRRIDQLIRDLERGEQNGAEDAD